MNAHEKKEVFDFTYDSYRVFLRKLKDKGVVQLFKNWKGERSFLLRHDVDFDVYLAHKLASLEMEENIQSTYFVLTSCHSYNVLSIENRNLLRDICSMGHEIGLHFDPSIYDSDLSTPFKRETDLLSFVVGQTVQSVSLHNPSIHGQYPMFDGFVNAYDPQMFSDANYISDSRFSFRGKDIYDFISNIRDSMIQIVFHPMHFSSSGKGYDKITFDVFTRYMNEIHANFLANSAYKEQVGEDYMANLRIKLANN